MDCRQVFQDAHDIQGLGGALSALGAAELMRGHLDVATGLERDALRYKYLAGDVEAIQTSHHNLGNRLLRGGQPEAALAHHLASAVLCTITGGVGAEESVVAAGRDLQVCGDSAVPADAAMLCRQVGQVPGVRLDQLLAALTGPQAAEDALRELTAQARAAAAAPPPTAAMARWFAAWDPVISGLAAADRGDTEAAAAVREYLVPYQGSADWAALAGALQRVLDGDRGEDLAAGRNQIDTAVVGRALGVLAGQASVPAALWPAMGLGSLLSRIVAAASGDQGAAERARHDLAELAAEPELAALVAALGRILDGSRDQAPDTLTDAISQAVVASVLAHITAAASTTTTQEEGT